MRRGVLNAKNIPELSSHPGKSLQGRTPYPLFGRFRFLNQCRPSQIARWNTATGLLLQPSFEGSGGKVSKDGKVDPSIGNHCQKASTIFLGLHYRSPNKTPNETDTAQARDLGKTDKMGHRA